MLFQHFRNFDNRQEVINNLDAIGQPETGSTLGYHETTRLLTRHSVVDFIQRHPNFKYILYATVTVEITIPPNSDQISLLPARPDGTTRLMVHWLCDLDDNGMNAKISNVLGLSPEVIGPEASLPFGIRPFNVYVASVVNN
ncbi:3ccee9d0-34a2-4974-b3c8-88f34aad5f09-CDS [Sclerotinia trifoliorum]|uniref:3ccee9d0-34a2-4974-b3c8-88f34aad5f09-CDS n=1 Tax=Sclerotinia trifoliorum TaxID=28548 RepID=A0A8H2ZMU1_9HELO|nr:3ccee9d0-34a2-4974-b3c8-88f34aad5f09-CDS [Sclerotinia trifoliorum]